MDIKDLHEFQREVLEDIAIPMTNEAKAIQEFTKGLSPSQLLSFNEDIPGFMKEYKKYQAAQVRKAEDALETKIEDSMNLAAEQGLF